MRIARILLLSSIASVAFTGSLRADQTWQNINVGGLTMDIPGVVGDYKGSASHPDELMFFSVEADDLGSMLCSLIQFPYTADLTREKMLSGIADDRSDVFCQEDGASVTGWELTDSGKTSVDGAYAGTCEAAYTDTSDSDGAGHVEADVVLAGRTRAYLLSCVVADKDKDAAVTSYEIHWQDDVDHMRESLRLPAAEK